MSFAFAFVGDSTEVALFVPRDGSDGWVTTRRCAGKVLLCYLLDIGMNYDDSRSRLPLATRILSQGDDLFQSSNISNKGLESRTVSI